MTISSENRKSGPFVGNGQGVIFPFDFKVFVPSDVLVIVTNTETLEENTLLLNSNYSVTMNSNQDSNPGGNVLLTQALPVGFNLVITSDVPYTQPTDIQNKGGFLPQVMEDSLDRTVIQIQQLDEKLRRAVVLPIGSSGDIDDLIQDIISVSNNSEKIEIVANNISDVNTVSNNIASVINVSTNISDVHNFSDVYQGSKASDPSLRNDGSALVSGDLYFNTSSNLMRVFNGTQWVNAYSTSGSITTPPQFDNTTKIATAEFVQRALGNTQGVLQIATNTTIPASDVGKTVVITGGTTATLPQLSSVPLGSTLNIFSTVSTTVSRAGTDTIIVGSGSVVNSISLGPNDSLLIVKYSDTQWLALGGSVQLRKASVFEASFSVNGYQKLPNGLIIQWGALPATFNATSFTVTFPIAFPNISLNVIGIVSLGASTTGAVSPVLLTRSATFATFRGDYSSSATSGQLYWTAIGY